MRVPHSGLPRYQPHRSPSSLWTAGTAASGTGAGRTTPTSRSRAASTSSTQLTVLRRSIRTRGTVGCALRVRKPVRSQKSPGAVHAGAPGPPRANASTARTPPRRGRRGGHRPRARCQGGRRVDDDGHRDLVDDEHAAARAPLPQQLGDPGVLGRSPLVGLLVGPGALHRVERPGEALAGGAALLLEALEEVQGQRVPPSGHGVPPPRSTRAGSGIDPRPAHVAARACVRRPHRSC